jgi:hypothetical protein
MVTKRLNGGEPWVRLSWIRGLQRLGFEVYFVEQMRPESFVDASGMVTSFDQSVNLAAFRDIAERFDLSDTSALIYGEAEKTFGLTYDQLLDISSHADILVNITGNLRLAEMKARVRRRVYIDEDPGFTQFWYSQGVVNALLADHDFYFTVGENIGTRRCSIPVGDIRWHSYRQPVVLNDWPLQSSNPPYRFTTVASWRGSYGSVQVGDTTFGLKAHEFRKFVDLPMKVDAPFEIALDIHESDGEDLALLCGHGWRIVDPRVVAHEPLTFQRYIQASSAEYSVAQGMYVDTNSGWFSDRSVRYLASGKPVLVQDTGFSDNYPVGDGLLAFRNMGDAVTGAGAIFRDYANHSRAARALAEEYFDSDKVLADILAIVE